MFGSWERGASPTCTARHEKEIEELSNDIARINVAFEAIKNLPEIDYCRNDTVSALIGAMIITKLGKEEERDRLFKDMEENS